MDIYIIKWERSHKIKRELVMEGEVLILMRSLEVWEHPKKAHALGTWVLLPYNKSYTHIYLYISLFFPFFIWIEKGVGVPNYATNRLSLFLLLKNKIKCRRRQLSDVLFPLPLSIASVSNGPDHSPCPKYPPL
jgi:hypothetical protein